MVAVVGVTLFSEAQYFIWAGLRGWRLGLCSLLNAVYHHYMLHCSLDY